MVEGLAAPDEDPSLAVVVGAKQNESERRENITKPEGLVYETKCNQSANAFASCLAGLTRAAKSRWDRQHR